MFNNFSVEEISELKINVLFTKYFNIDKLIADGFPVNIVDELNTEDGQELFYYIVLKNPKGKEK